MELFRSTDMTYVALTMTNEASHVTVRELGKFGRLHVHDLSAAEKGAPHKSLIHYKKRVQDCLTLEKRLTAMKETMVQYNIPLDEQPIQELHTVHGDLIESCRADLAPMEQELSDNVSFLRENKLSIASLIERRHVLNAVKGGLISDVMRNTNSSIAGDDFGVGDGAFGDEDTKMVGPESDSLHIRNVLVGTIPTDQQLIFARMLYRVSRGNAFARFKEIKRGADVRSDASADAVVEPRSVFYAVVLGEVITQRVRRMCDTFRVNLFAVPPTPEEIRNQIDRIRQDVADKRDVEARTENAIQGLLARWGSSDETGSTPIRDWQNAIMTERQVCQTLMKAHFYLTMISLEGYVPTADVPDLKRACKRAVENTGHPPAAIEIDPAGTVVPDRPPTAFPLNKFTACFQGIVDTYGVPRYKEANPGLFTIISFPFLFGVMYGDIGHGLALTLFASTLLYYEAPLLELERKRQLGEIPSMAFGGRYILLLMGLFAVYCGMIYNDCLSIPINAWGSNYHHVANSSALAWNGDVYPIGIDPGWAHKSNSLAFANSMKMKMAVSLGVTQMVFGICLSLSNHLYFKDRISVYFEFIPRMVFMFSTFGYMVFMIWYKWCVDWTQRSNGPPNLIQTMISMFLSPGNVEDSKQLYSGQAGFQGFLLFCAFISVPCMLFGKPYAHKYLHEKKRHAYTFAGSIQADSGDADDDESLEEKSEWATGSGLATRVPTSEAESLDEVHDEFSFSDEMIHNAIHTIEFVLGCVSNTASYLRLWALSLAHAQLAEVFWTKVLMEYGILNGPFGAFAGFAVWVGATTAVLLCMDVLECFLHALRLHWVEFQNKFFYADGTAFEPFMFEDPAVLYL